MDTPPQVPKVSFITLPHHRTIVIDVDMSKPSITLFAVQVEPVWEEIKRVIFSQSNGMSKRMLRRWRRGTSPKYQRSQFPEKANTGPFHE